MLEIQTDRLILRPLVEADLDAFAALNSDAEVMRFFPALQSREQTAALIARSAEKWQTNGFGFSAVAFKETRQFIGMAGLNRFEAEVEIAPCVEIGWRFAKSAWGQGLASEAAVAWLKYGFEHIEINEIFSFSPRQNVPSQAVMRRIGMRRTPEFDFEHPMIEAGHPLRPMAVCRLTAQEYKEISVA